MAAFEAMDQQLSEEALAFLLGPKMSKILQEVPRWDWEPWWNDTGKSQTDKMLRTATLSVAMSGAVGSVAHLSGNNLLLANTGDCQVCSVLIVQSFNLFWYGFLYDFLNISLTK